jgi:cell division protein DivIC
MSFTQAAGSSLIRTAVVTSRRLIVLIYFVLLIGGGVWAGAMLLEARAEYEQLKQVQAASEAKLAAAEARLREQERILQRLRTDPAYVEKVIRKQLGYARPGEVIFRFDSGL